MRVKSSKTPSVVLHCTDGQDSRARPWVSAIQTYTVLKKNTVLIKPELNPGLEQSSLPSKQHTRSHGERDRASSTQEEGAWDPSS